MTENQYTLDIQQIQKFLPHRPPFLLVDRILSIHPAGDSTGPAPFAGVGTRVVALKNVSFNEPYFEGHFPGFPIVPGVLLIETMAQVASFSVYPSLQQEGNSLGQRFRCILVGVDETRFRKPVVPGDTLRIETEVTKSRGKMWGFHCIAFVGEEKVAETHILAHLLQAPVEEVS